MRLDTHDSRRPCNNLSACNRATGVNGRSGLKGAQSRLFYVLADIFAYLCQPSGTRKPCSRTELEGRAKEERVEEGQDEGEDRDVDPSPVSVALGDPVLLGYRLYFCREDDVASKALKAERNPTLRKKLAADLIAHNERFFDWDSELSTKTKFLANTPLLIPDRARRVQVCRLLCEL